jgi:hypothetical protein
VQDLDLHLRNTTKATDFTIRRDIDPKPSIKYGTTLVDIGNEDLVSGNKSFVSVPVDDTWYVVQHHDSAIFVDKNGMFYFHNII